MYKPKFTTNFVVYTYDTHTRQVVATFQEAVCKARRLASYGFMSDVDVENWRNGHTKNAISSTKVWRFRANGKVELYEYRVHFFHNGDITQSYYRYNR